METQILDVTVIEPKLKHPTIFKRFDELTGGEELIIHNDHDPKPLYYQLLAERGQIFNWEYLMSGPEVWRVLIGKKNPHNQEETIGEIVAKDYRKAMVFKKLGIDFCCGGKKTLTEACVKKGLAVEEVKLALQSADNGEYVNAHNFQDWALDFLSDYVVNVHHKYVRDNIPFIDELATKVARVHGDKHPELIVVANVFATVAQELSMHMIKEERILFPYIRDMVTARELGTAVLPAPFGGVMNPIQMMEMEHEGAGEELEEIRQMTNNYTLPEDACTSYRILFQKLQEFENDLHTHVHLENNILFPKSVQLEQQLKDNSQL